MSNGPPLVALLLQLVGSALLLAVPVPYWTKELGHGALAAVGGVLCVSVVALFALTAATDPGVMPRCAAPEQEPNAGVVRPPRRQQVLMHGRHVTSEYCDPCNIYQPPETVHCSVCGNCVRRFDHHCPWVGNCIGARNYRFFFGFLVLTTVLLVFCIGISAAHLVDLGEKLAGSTDVLVKGAGSIVLAVFSSFLIFFVVAVLVFHIQLMRLNRTTYLHLQNKNIATGRGLRVASLLLFGDRGTSYLPGWAQLNATAPAPGDPPPTAAAKAAVDAAVYALGCTPVARRVALDEFDPSLFFFPSSHQRDTEG